MKRNATAGPGLRVLGAAVLVVLVGACSSVGHRPASAPAIPPGRTFLTVVADPARASRPASRVCSSADPVVLQCDLVPLVPPALSLCPPIGTSEDKGTSRDKGKANDIRDAMLPCRLPGAEQRRMGWNLSQGPAPGRAAALSVFLGEDSVRQVLDARDAGSSWAAVAVCPRDITADDLTDLVVAFRTRDRPEVLDVEAVDLTRLPLTVLVLPPELSPAAAGQGCEAPAVRGLRYDADHHELVVDPGVDGSTRART